MRSVNDQSGKRGPCENRIGEETSPIRRAILRAAHSKAVCCPLPGKCLLMQAWPPLAGLIAQKKPPPRFARATVKKRKKEAYFFMEIERFAAFTMAGQSRPYFAISSSIFPDSPNVSGIPTLVTGVGQFSDRHSQTAPPRAPIFW